MVQFSMATFHNFFKVTSGFLYVAVPPAFPVLCLLCDKLTVGVTSVGVGKPFDWWAAVGSKI